MRTLQEIQSSRRDIRQECRVQGSSCLVCDAAVLQSLNLKRILSSSLESLVATLELDAADVRLLEGDRLLLKADLGETSDFVAAERVTMLGECSCGRCAETGRTIMVSDLGAEPALSHTRCTREGFRSVICLPMSARGRTLGVLHLASRQTAAFPLEEQPVLEALADRIALAVANAQLYAEVRRRAEHLEAASLIGQRLAANLDLDALLSEAVRIIREKFGYYCTSVLLVDKGSNELVLRETSGPEALPAGVDGLRLKIQSAGIQGRVVLAGQAWLCNDVSREPPAMRACLAARTQAQMAVPLRAGSRVIGVLDVQSDRRGGFHQGDLTVMQILGSQLGVAIENTRLFQETRSRYDAMLALHQTSVDVISQLEMPELLNALVQRSIRLVGAEAGVLRLHDAAQGTCPVVASQGTWQDISGSVVRPGEGVSGQVILTGEPLIVHDYPHWDGRVEELAASHHTRIMGVPLKWQGEVIGSITVLNRPEQHRFDREDQWLLSQFADLATIAVKNAELHAEVKGFGHKLEQTVQQKTRELARTRQEVEVKAQQLASLLSKTMRIQEEERGRVARDMHDGVVQLITGVRYEIQAAKVAYGLPLERDVQARLDAAREMLAEMEAEIRRVIHDLNPPVLNAVGLAPAVQKHARDFEELTGIECRVRIQGKPRRLLTSLEGGVFRMVEEALHNVASHSGASAVCVTLDFGATALSVNVEDNGCGFDYEAWAADPSGENIGIIGMQERVKTLAGRMELSSKPGKGTRLSFRLPLELNHG